MIIVFRGLIHVAEKDFPRSYDFSWRKDSIVFGISRDAVDIVSREIEDDFPSLEYPKNEFGFEKFGCDFNAERYGYDDCASVSRLADGSIELSFSLILVKDKESLQHICACAATIHVLTNFLMRIPEREINDPLPQFICISTECCRNKSGGHGGHIAGELNKDVKRYLINHYRTKGERLSIVLRVLLRAAEVLSGKKKRAEKNLYWAEVRSEKGFLSIDCPGNSCGLNTEETDEAFFLLKKGMKEEDFGMDLICHNVDDILQQVVLLAALAALSDEVKKYYLNSRND